MKLAKVNILKSSNESNEIQRKPGKPRKDDRTDKSPGPISNYAPSEHELGLRNFVSRMLPRHAIYHHLYECDVLMEHLKFLHYTKMMRCKYSDVNEIVKSKKAMERVNQKSLTGSKHSISNTKNSCFKKMINK